VRVERRPTKKLIVAFHFLRGEGARWECDACRKQGLEARRRCGFLPAARRSAKRIVWARGPASTEECPKSLVTAESLELMERFFASRAWGNRGWTDPTAREADAFLVLEQELRVEGANGR
jgi:hypothetical protein